MSEGLRNRTLVLLHHRGVLVGRAVLDGCGVDFSGNGGHFFGLGTARQRLARTAYFTAIDVARAAQPGSGLTFGHDLSFNQFQGSLVQISMVPCQLVQTTLLSRLCLNVRPAPGCPGCPLVRSLWAMYFEGQVERNRKKKGADETWCTV